LNLREKYLMEDYKGCINIGKQKSQIGNKKDINRKEINSSFDYDRENNLSRRHVMKFKVKVKEMPEMNIVYIRHRGSYNQIGPAIHAIIKWCAARDLIHFPETKILTVYHDDPDITQMDKLRADACVKVPKGTKTEGEVGTYVISGVKFAVAHVEITADEFGEAWDKLVGEWIPENGYQSDERLCYEISLNNPKEHPEGKFIVDICEPIKPL
jgi:AraC family transcriptional regulator